MPAPSAESVYLFRHALLRDAAYQLQLPSDRTKLHRLAFELLLFITPSPEMDAVAAEVADHARLAGDLPPELQRAEIDLLVRAEAFVYGRQSAQATLPLADRILAHPLSDVTLRHRISASKALALGNLGRIQEATELQEKCLGAARADGGAAMPELLISASLLALRTGRVAEGTSMLEEALRLLPPGDSKRAARRATALLNLGVLHLEQGRPGEARPFLLEARELALRTGDPRTAALSALNLAGARAAMGEGDAKRDFEECLRLCQSARSRAGEMNARVNLCSHAVSSGDYQAAREHALRIQDLARETGLVRYEVMALLELSRISRRSGAPEAARALTQQALALCEVMRNPVLTASARCERALQARMAGDEAGASREWAAAQVALGSTSGFAVGVRARLDEDCDLAGVEHFAWRPGTR
ncbi:MAG: tetratricopeptide repeat protein [Planctomycetota bacterium]